MAMNSRAQLRRLMSDVDAAATRAERSLKRARQRSAALSFEEPKGALALRSSLLLASLAMAAKILVQQD